MDGRGGRVNIKLHAVSDRVIGDAASIHRLDPSPNRHGLQRIVHGASRRLAHRRANLLTEQESDRVWFWRLVRHEVERARRHDGAFSVLCVESTDASALADLAHALRPGLRDTDAVSVERDRLLVLLGETSGNQARQVGRRIAEHADRLLDDGRWHDVEFPRDALTLGALVESLMHPDAGARFPLTG